METNETKTKSKQITFPVNNEHLTRKARFVFSMRYSVRMASPLQTRGTVLYGDAWAIVVP